MIVANLVPPFKSPGFFHLFSPSSQAMTRVGIPGGEAHRSVKPFLPVSRTALVKPLSMLLGRHEGYSNRLLRQYLSMWL